MKKLQMNLILWLTILLLISISPCVLLAQQPADLKPCHIFDMDEILDQSTLSQHFYGNSFTSGVRVDTISFHCGDWKGIHRQDWVNWVNSNYQGTQPVPVAYPWIVEALLYTPVNCDYKNGYGIVAQTSSANNDLGEAFWDEYGIEACLMLNVPVLLIDTPPESVISEFDLVDENVMAGASRQWVLRMELDDPVDLARLHLRYPMALSYMRGITLLTMLAENNDSNLNRGAIILGSSKRGLTAWAAAVSDDRIKGIVSCAADGLNILSSYERAINDWYHDTEIVEYLTSQLAEMLDPALNGQLFLDYFDPYTFLQNPNIPQNFTPMIVSGASDDMFPIRALNDFFINGPLTTTWHKHFVPNYEHGCGTIQHVDALRGLAAHLFENRALPSVEHTATVDFSTLYVDASVTTPNIVTEVNLIYATKETGDRQFIHQTWNSVPMTEMSGGQYSASVGLPEIDGWIAFYVEVSDVDNNFSLPFHASSLPEILPGYDNISDVSNDETSNLIDCKLSNTINPTSISYTINIPGNVKLSIYDLRGRIICQPVNRYQTEGTYELLWDGKNSQMRPMPSGVYFVKIENNGVTDSGRVLLVK